MSVCVCAWCNMSFEGKRSDSLFCNPACKQKYWRWKHHLDLDRKTIMVTIDNICAYLANPATEHQACLVLGEVVDRLCALGFIASDEAMAVPIEVPSNFPELGE